MKMQVTSLAVFLFATLATSSAQNTTAVTDAQNATAGMETTFSGDGGTEECTKECVNGGTCSVVEGNSICICLPGFSGDSCQTDNCLDNDCQNGAICIGTASNYDCECSPGYAGDFCGDKVACSATTQTRNESLIRDVADCNSTYVYVPDTDLRNLTFSGADAGSWTQSTEKCTESCVVPDMQQPIAIARCNEASGIYDEFQYTDCSAGAGDLTSEEQLPYAIVASDPETATPTQVDYAVTTTTDFISTSSSIDANQAGQSIDVYNNLLQVIDAGSKARVNDQSNEILTSIDELSAIVDVAPISRAAEDEFIDIDTNIALAVVSISGTGEATFAAEEGWASASDLTAAGLRVETAQPDSGTFMTASGTGVGTYRVSFRAYMTSDVLFSNLPGNVVLQRTVLSASIVTGSPSSQEFVFNFENNQPKATVGCQRWQKATREWGDGGCSASLQSNYDIRCICSEPGEYVAIATVVTEEGLSPGAIAGIVIGSVAAAALIGGGIYYFAVVKKKKANSIHMEMDEADDAVPKAAAPKDASPKAEVPEVTDTESRTEA